MSSDIVERLRVLHKQQEPWDMHKQPIYAQAADEIERLNEWRTNALLALDKREAIIATLTAEIERLRAAIDSLLFDIDGDHIPEWASDEAKAAGKKPWCCRWCGPQDGDWPCGHRTALDELKEAIGRG